MKTYKIILHPISSITKISDSQTIFGAICSIILFTKGEAELKSYIQSFSNDPLFIHSSMFPEGLLPMAKVGLITIHEKNEQVFKLPAAEQLKYASNLKQFKSIRYVSEKIYNDYLVDGYFKELREDIDGGKVKLNNGIVSENDGSFNAKAILRTHNRQSFTTSREDDSGRLYYINDLFTDSDFCIFVKTDDIKYVLSIFEYFPFFGIGNRISTGNNCYQVKTVKEIQTPMHHTEDRMLLSKCISTEFDLNQSSYMLSSALYGSSKYYSSAKTGRINKFIEGSYMHVHNVKEYYGRLLPVENDKKLWHYGIGFVL